MGNELPDGAGGDRRAEVTEPDHVEMVMRGLRAFAADYTELTHQLGKWFGVSNATDGVAFAEILYAEDMGRPMSPAVLSRRLGITSGATTALINRLEAAGLLLRTREHTDRRVVTLRATPIVSAEAGDFFAPVAQRVDAVTADRTPEFMAQVADLLKELHTALADLVHDVPNHVPPRDRAQASES